MKKTIYTIVLFSVSLFSTAQIFINSINNAESNINGFDVTKYGINSANDATVNATALRTLTASIPTGSTIYFPPASAIYSFNTITTITDKKFIFTSVGLASLCITGNTQLFNIVSTTTNVLSSGCQFTNLYFTSTNNGVNQCAIYFSNMAGGNLVNNCIFQNMPLAICSGSTELSTNLGGKIFGNTFYNCHYGFQGLTRSEFYNISINDFIKCGTAISCAGGNNIISNNNINYDTTGIEILTGTNNGHGIISTNNINHCITWGVNIKNTTLGMTLIGNHIYQSPIQFSVTTGCKIIGGDIDVNSLSFVTNTDLEIDNVYFPNGYANTPSVSGTYPRFFKCTGTIPLGFDNNCGDWIDYSNTSTIIGWTSFTTKIITYTIIGKMLKISYSINGTSNTTTISFTLPYTNLITSRDRGCYAVNNGVAITTGGVAFVNTNSSTVTIYTDWALNSAWVNVGTKQVVGEIEFQITQ